MRHLRGLSKSAWIIAGLLAGLIIAPATAVAATVMILHGANGPAVNASKDNQLLTAEAPPSTWVSEYGFNGQAGSCSNLPVVSKTRGFIVRQVNVQIFESPTSGSVAYIYRGPGCLTKNTVGIVNANGGNVVYPFDPGIALPPRGQLSVLFNGPGGGINVNVLGYTVPASDAPGYTPVLKCAIAKGACVDGV